MSKATLILALVLWAGSAYAGDLMVDKARWIEKASKTLRGGRGIESRDELDRFMAMEKPEIVDELMGSSRFDDTVVDLVLYYLKRQTTELKEIHGYRDGEQYLTYSKQVFGVPQAIYAARLVNGEGDFFKIFSDKIPKFVEPAIRLQRQSIGVDVPEDYEDDDIIIIDDDEIIVDIDDDEAIGESEDNDYFGEIGIPPEYRVPTPIDDRPAEIIRDVYRKEFEEATKEYFRDVDFAFDEFEVYSAANGVVYALDSYIRRLGAPAALAGQIQRLVSAKGRPWLFVEGPSFNLKKKKVRELMREIVGLAITFEDFLHEIPTRSAPEYFVRDLVELPLPIASLERLSSPWTIRQFWNPLRNSSTNFNRKRAAYILETFFCDDLTPLGIVDDGMPPSEQHGADGSCANCHYKLDPMGGLFRNYGVIGVFQDPSGMIVFDDQKVLNELDYSDYLSSWKDNSGAYNVGYFTAPGTPHSAWTGDSFKDLWTFIPRSEEARMCLVRRVAEYVLGPEQVYDLAWLDQISEDFRPGSGSSAALKEYVKRLVLSATFDQADPEQGTCYDRAEGETSPLPCAISHTIKTVCKSCHNSDNPAGGLDVSQWIEISEGEMGFVHVKDDTQLSKQESFTSIMDRLTTSDASLRMPQAGFLSDGARQQLYLWLEGEIR